ncbi:MAG: dienelactone hydrolase family protein [Hyphomicrobiaceae bacterium]|nr:dienelactone hydrolase family protein [Hyphomicrobiaceae bacterium]
MTIIAHFVRPVAEGKRPAVIALHGCGGPLSRNGGLSRRHMDWGLRLSGLGYAVVFPNSFGSRGHGPLCRARPRPVKQSQRAKDVFAAYDWLIKQPFVDPKRIALLGWSNGAGTVLRVATLPQARVLKTAIAFYPSCKFMLSQTSRTPKIPISILIGESDDWTPAQPCVELSKKWTSPIHVYPGAYHGFDTPNSKLRVRKGVAFSANGSGEVHVGTNPAARDAAIKEVERLLGKI